MVYVGMCCYYCMVKEKLIQGFKTKEIDRIIPKEAYEIAVKKFGGTGPLKW